MWLHLKCDCMRLHNTIPTCHCSLSLLIFSVSTAAWYHGAQSEPAVSGEEDITNVAQVPVHHRFISCILPPSPLPLSPPLSPLPYPSPLPLSPPIHLSHTPLPHSFPFTLAPFLFLDHSGANSYEYSYRLTSVTIKDCHKDLPLGLQCLARTLSPPFLQLSSLFTSPFLPTSTSLPFWPFTSPSPLLTHCRVPVTTG